jgi:hypothetical protein
LAGDIAAKFLAAVLSRPRVRRLLSSEHFSVDRTLIEAWASMKSFKPKHAPSTDIIVLSGVPKSLRKGEISTTPAITVMMSVPNWFQWIATPPSFSSNFVFGQHTPALLHRHWAAPRTRGPGRRADAPSRPGHPMR